MRLQREFTILYLFLIAVVQATMAIAAQLPHSTNINPIDPLNDSMQTPGSDAVNRSNRAMQETSGTTVPVNPRY